MEIRLVSGNEAKQAAHTFRIRELFSEKHKHVCVVSLSVLYCSLIFHHMNTHTAVLLNCEDSLFYLFISYCSTVYKMFTAEECSNTAFLLHLSVVNIWMCRLMYTLKDMTSLSVSLTERFL